MKKRVFLIGSCQSNSDTKILDTITTELEYTIHNVGPEARVNTISDLKGEKLAKTMRSQYSFFSGENILVSPEFISNIGLWSIGEILGKSDVLILVFSQPLEMVYTWLSAQNQILSKTPIVSYPKIDSLLTRPPYFG